MPVLPTDQTPVTPVNPSGTQPGTNNGSNPITALTGEERVFLCFRDTQGVFRKPIDANSVVDLSFGIERKGGYGSFNCTIGTSDRGTDIPLDASAIEIWHYTRSGRWLFLYSGSVSKVTPQSQEPFGYEISAFGKYINASRIVIGKDFIYPGKVDNSVLFADVVTNSLQDKITLQGKIIEQFGATSDRGNFNGKTVGDAFDEIINISGGNGHWGLYTLAPLYADGTPDMITSRSEFLRAGPLKIANKEVTHNLTTGVQGLINVEPLFDTSDICNVLYIAGGEYTYPNLVSNGYFQNLMNGSDNPNNLIRNSSFENRDGGGADNWQAGSGPFMSSKNVTDEPIQPLTGNWMVEGDSNGEYIQQQYDNFISSGKPYNLKFYTCLENIGSPVTMRVVLTWIVSGGSDVVGVDNQFVISQANGWQYGVFRAVEYQSKPPSGASGYKLKITVVSCQGSGKGVYLDDVSLWYANDLYQDSWIPYKENNGVNKNIIWNIDDSPVEGYAVRLDVQDNDGLGGIKNTVNVPINNGQYMRFTFWVRSMTDGTSPAVSLQVQNGEAPKKLGSLLVPGQFDFRRVGPTQGALTYGEWKKYELVIDETYDDLRSFIVKILVHDTGVVDVAGVCARDLQEGIAVAPGPFKLRIKAQDYYGPAVSGNPLSGISPYTDTSDVRYKLFNSQNTFGWREKLESVDSIARVADALEFADAYFTEYALPRNGATIELHSPDELYWAGELVRVWMPHTGTIELPIVSVNYNFDGTLKCTIDTEVERKDIAAVLSDVIKNRVSTSSVYRPVGTVSAIPGIAGTTITRSETSESPDRINDEVVNARTRDANGVYTAQTFADLKAHFAAVWQELNTVKGSSGTAYFGTIGYSSTNPTLHDDYRPNNGPHILVAERSSWNATTNEVGNARNRTISKGFVTPIVFPSLQANLNTVWDTFGSYVLSPVNQLAGKVAVTTGNNSIEWRSISGDAGAVSGFFQELQYNSSVFQKRRFKFQGAGVSVTEDNANNLVNVTITGGSGTNGTLISRDITGTNSEIVQTDDVLFLNAGVSNTSLILTGTINGNKNFYIKRTDNNNQTSCLIKTAELAGDSVAFPDGAASQGTAVKTYTLSANEGLVLNARNITQQGGTTIVYTIIARYIVSNNMVVPAE